MSHRYCIRGAVAALALTLVVSGASGLAAQTGSVTGVVTDATTGQPLDGARVSLAGTRISALTGSGGRYLLGGVPAGAQTVKVVIIGYGTREREVTVTSGSTLESDFRLQVSGVDLDQPVTAGAGPSERRKIGISLPAIDFDGIAEAFPVEGFSQALEGRIPGVRSNGTHGGIGAGRELRIRGTDSFGFTRQRPLVLIDGVRVDTEKLEWGAMVGVTCCSFSGGAGEDRLSDLSPEEIDRVEVLKGPAAAALFGVEGSAGVIQVFTKRGRTNTPPAFTVTSGFGFNRLRANLPTRLRPNFTGPYGFAAWDPNEHLIENGLVNNYDLTISGGGRDVTYFAAGGLTYEEGSVKPSDQTRANLRVNLNWSAADNLSVDVASGFVRNRIRPLQTGNNWLGVFTNAMLSNPFDATEEEPYGGGLSQEVAVADAQAIRTVSEADRWTGRVQVNYKATPNFTHRLTIGADRVSERKTRTLPWGRYYTYLGDRGERNVGSRHSGKFTVDFLSTYDYEDLAGMRGLSGSLSVGAQAYWDDVSTAMATGRGYHGPVSTLHEAEETVADERMFERRGRGVFAMNRLDLGRDLSVTTAVRVDGRSAFGDDVGPQVYPKAAMGYNVPHSVLPAPISNLKVRGAIGMAGKLPPKVSGGGGGGSLPSGYEIDPENKRELETGLDLGLLNDRIGVEFTYYDARVLNALFHIHRHGPEGIVGRPENCCEIMNRGIEAVVRAWLIDTPGFRWNSNLTYEWNRNRITDLGDTAADDSMPLYEQRGDGTWEHVGWRRAAQLNGWFVGESLGNVWQNAIAGYDRDTNRHIRTEHYFRHGPIQPIHLGSIFNSFQIGDNLRVAFQLRGEMGAMMVNVGRAHGVREGAYDEYLAHLAPDGSTTFGSDSVADYHRTAYPIDKRDHVRLQEVSVSYTVPEGMAGRIGLKRTTVTLSGYNLHWWDDCNCTDPSQKSHASDFTAMPFMGLPQPRRFLLSVRTRF